MKSATGEALDSHGGPNYDHETGSAPEAGEEVKHSPSSSRASSSSPSPSTSTHTQRRRKTPHLLSSESLPVLPSRSLSPEALDLHTGTVTVEATEQPKPKPPCIDKLEALMTSAKSQGMSITKLFGSFVPLPTALAIGEIEVEAAAAAAAAAANSSSAEGDGCSLPLLHPESNGQSSTRSHRRGRTTAGSTGERRTLDRRTQSGEFDDHASTAAGEGISHSSPGTSSCRASQSVSPRRGNPRTPPLRSLSSGYGLRSLSRDKLVPILSAPVVEVSAIGRAALGTGLAALASHRDKDVHFSDEEVDLIMKYLDENRSGEIELWEFAAFCLRIPSVTWKAERSRRGVRSCNDEEMIIKAAKAIHTETMHGLHHSGPSQASLDKAAIDEEKEHSSKESTPPPLPPPPVDEREVIEPGSLLKEGSKLFWRTREHVEYAIYENSGRGLLSMFTHHLELGLVFPALLINLHKLPAVVVRESTTARLAELERKKKEETNAGLFDLDEKTKKLLLEQARIDVICDFLEARLQIPSEEDDHSTSSASSSPSTRPTPIEDIAAAATRLDPLAGPSYLHPDHPTGSNSGHGHSRGSSALSSPASELCSATQTEEERAALVIKHPVSRQPYLMAGADLMFVSELGKGVKLVQEHKFRTSQQEVNDRKLPRFQSFRELNERLQRDRTESKRFTMKAVATAAEVCGVLATYGTSKAAKEDDEDDVDCIRSRRAHTFANGQSTSPAHLKMLSKLEGTSAKLSKALSPRSPRRLEPLPGAGEAARSGVENDFLPCEQEVLLADKLC